MQRTVRRRTRWSTSEANKKDTYLGFPPGNGIHEIHMRLIDTDQARNPGWPLVF